jgi:hypothetical protein
MPEKERMSIAQPHPGATAPAARVSRLADEASLLADYFTPSNLTSKSKVAFGGMTWP